MPIPFRARLLSSNGHKTATDESQALPMVRAAAGLVPDPTHMEVS